MASAQIEVSICQMMSRPFLSRKTCSQGSRSNVIAYKAPGCTRIRSSKTLVPLIFSRYDTSSRPENLDSPARREKRLRMSCATMKHASGIVIKVWRSLADRLKEPFTLQFQENTNIDYFIIHHKKINLDNDIIRKCVHVLCVLLRYMF